jgi:putative acetyltransferase
MNQLFTIRTEREADISAVRQINERAFGRSNEAKLVDRLRESCAEIISLVAQTSDQTIIGHAMFSPVTIECDDGGTILLGTALGPIAVDYEYQRKGAGGALIRAGLDKIKNRHLPFVVVLGHPEYYPRFGFEPAESRYGIRSQWKVSDAVFMIQILDATVMQGARGVARYRDEFENV